MADTFFGGKFTTCAKEHGLFSSLCFSDADWLGRQTPITWQRARLQSITYYSICRSWRIRISGKSCIYCLHKYFRPSIWHILERCPCNLKIKCKGNQVRDAIKSLSLSLSLFLFLSLFLSLSLSVSISVSLSLSLSLFLSLSLSLSLFLSLCLCFSLSLSHSHSVCLSPPLSVSLFVCPHPSLIICSSVTVCEM